MEKTWDIVKTVAGAFVIVYAIQGGWALAKELGKKELLKEMDATPTIKNGKAGEPVVVQVNGQSFSLKLEKIEK